MSSNSIPGDDPREALEPFQPRPNTHYSLDTTSHLTGVSRRTILIYCRHGLVQPRSRPVDEALFFTDESIHAIRRIERLRQDHRINLAGIRMITRLTKRIDELQREVRFYRDLS